MLSHLSPASDPVVLGERVSVPKTSLCSYCLLAQGSALLRALPKVIHLILTPTRCGHILILCIYYR